MISIFGASVTQQKNGYAVHLKRILQEKIEIHGYGGMNLNNAGICYLSEASKNNPDFCFVDWFTTGYNKCNEETSAYIDTIIYHFNALKCRVVFLFLPYKNDPQKPLFYAYCKDVLDQRSFPYIDISEHPEINDIDKVLRDNVHTTDFGSHIYAQLIAKKFNALKDKLQISQDSKKTVFNDIHRLHVRKEFFKQILLSGNCEIIGLLLTIGPYSGKVLISSCDTQQTVNTWDRWCHYTRLNFNLESPVHGDTTIQILQDTFDTSSCKIPVKFSRIPKKLVVHDIYYIGEHISILNLCDGHRIKRLRIFLSRMMGRIRQRFQLITKRSH